MNEADSIVDAAVKWRKSNLALADLIKKRGLVMSWQEVNEVNSRDMELAERFWNTVDRYIAAHPTNSPEQTGMLLPLGD